METSPGCQGPVLLVGEGDFSFTCALSHHLNDVPIISTSLLSQEDIQLHKSAHSNIDYLTRHGI